MVSYAGAVGIRLPLVNADTQPHVPKVCHQFLDAEDTDGTIGHIWDITYH